MIVFVFVCLAGFGLSLRNMYRVNIIGLKCMVRMRTVWAA